MNRVHHKTGIGLICLGLFSVSNGGMAAETEATEEDEPANGEIVVTGSRTDRTQKDSVVSVQVIGREEIETSGAMDAAGLLIAQPGVESVRSFAGTTVRLQGLNPEHVLVLVDGQRVIGRKAGSIDLSRYPVDWIERIEIVKGPSSVLYGSDAMGGVINIITRKADAPFSTDVYGSYGIPQSLDTSGSIATKRSSFGTRIHGGYHSTDGYDLDPDTLTTDGSERQTLHIGSISDIVLNANWTIAPRISYRQENKERVSESGGGAVFDDRNLSEEVQGALASDIWFTDARRLRATAFATWYRDQYNSDQRESEALDAYQDTRELLTQGALQYDHGFSSGHQTTVGVDVLGEQMQSDRLADGEGDRQRLGVFAQDEWTLPSSNRFVVLPSFRFDFDSQFGNHTTPRFALRYDPRKNIGIRAGIGWGYRAPGFKELLLRFENPSAGYIVEGSPSLKPETLRNVNAGVDWDATSWLRLSLSGYRNDVNDLIGISTLDNNGAGPTQYGYVNIAEAITQGGEFTAAIQPSTLSSITIGYTLNDTLDITNDRPLEGRSLHRVSGQVQQYVRATGTSFNIRGAWDGQKPYYVDTDGDEIEETVTTNPTTLIDTRIAQPLPLGRTKMQLFVGSENILNTGNSDYLPLPPRTIYFGLMGRYATKPNL